MTRYGSPLATCSHGRPIRRCALAAAATVLLRCGATPLTVPSHPQPGFAPAEPVSFAPPPAQIETFASEPPAPGCLWADGQWVWVAQRWDWRPGRWISPAPGCRYSAPTLEWVASAGSSVLYYRPGRWYSETEPKPCPDPPSCGGGPPASTLTPSPP